MNRVSITSGNPPSAARLYMVLVSFINSTIDGFRPLTNSPAEDAITADLSRYFNLYAQSNHLPFVFVNQDLRADIGVHGIAYIPENSKKFCWIEAKRLPTPKGQSRDEREYVFVDHANYNGNGGIERFKLNKHGEGLPVSIMIGYVQENDFGWWFNQVNKWLGEYSTTPPFHIQEYLQEYSVEPGRFYSQHERYSAAEQKWMSPFKLFHFWINL